VHEFRVAAGPEVIDTEALRARWQTGPLAVWAAQLAQQVEAAFATERHGDLPRWQQALAQLPDLAAEHIALDQDCVSIDGPCTPQQRARLESALRLLHPWRKGPFSLFGLPIDTEWRSDWKWARLAPHIQPLTGRRVLDIGCGSGYHCWRMRGAGAGEVIGIEPSLLYVMQFLALQHYVQAPEVHVLPITLEQLPPALHAFDTVFSMGILYHRRSPFAHLARLRDCLRRGGELVLETLVIEGDANTVLVPEGRYASMRNVWFLPSAEALQAWLRKQGWGDVRLVDVNVTAADEQRSTAWMQFHSLADFLDPADPARTREGHPAPRRAIVLATA